MVLELVQRTLTKMVKSLEHKCYKEWIREPGFSLWKSRVMRDLVVTCKYLKENCNEGQFLLLGKKQEDKRK